MYSDMIRYRPMLTASLKHLGNYMLIAIVRQDARTKVRA